ncbi:RNA polymerase sigma factor [Frateuria aurantia]
MPDSTIDASLRELLPALRRFALWLTRDLAAADDLVQAALEKALSNWGRRREESALRSWLFTILYRQFVDTRRRASRYRAMLDHFSRDDTAQQPSAEREVVAQSVLQSLDLLPEEQRNLLLWTSVEGLSYQEIAQILEIPLGTVMSRLSRARQALRQLSDGNTKTPALRLLK